MTVYEKQLIDEKFVSAAERTEAYRRLEAHEPLAYILGEWYFYGEKYLVTPDVLIPRSDTEILVETAVKRIPFKGIFADLCTGSGCVAVSVLCHRPDLTAKAADISGAAIKIAHENAVLNGVDKRLDFFCGDITALSFPEAFTGDRQFDALLSNPPYIVSETIGRLQPEVQAEPRIALDGGRDGLRFYRALCRLRRKMLKTGGIGIFEIGCSQAASVMRLFGGGEVLKDYGGNDRVFIV